MARHDIKLTTCPFKVMSFNGEQLVETTNQFLGLTDENFTGDFEKIRRDALKAGNTILEANGSKLWRTTEPIIHPERGGGSALYDWHNDGDRVRSERVEYTLPEDGERQRRVLRRVWARP